MKNAGKGISLKTWLLVPDVVLSVNYRCRICFSCMTDLQYPQRNEILVQGSIYDFFFLKLQTDITHKIDKENEMICKGKHVELDSYQHKCHLQSIHKK